MGQFYLGTKVEVPTLWSHFTEKAYPLHSIAEITVFLGYPQTTEIAFLVTISALKQNAFVDSF